MGALAEWVKTFASSPTPSEFDFEKGGKERKNRFPFPTVKDGVRHDGTYDYCTKTKEVRLTKGKVTFEDGTTKLGNFEYFDEMKTWDMRDGLLECPNIEGGRYPGESFSPFALSYFRKNQKQKAKKSETRSFNFFFAKVAKRVFYFKGVKEKGNKYL